MADSVVTKILARIQATRTVGMGVGTQKYPATVEEALDWPDGTSASTADEMWTDDAGSVGAGANDDLDLTALAQLDDDGDATGRTVNFAKIKLLFIRNTSSAGNLAVGAAAANPWIDSVGTEGWLDAASDILNIPNGGFEMIGFPAGVVVTNGASDILRIAGVGSTQTYEIIIIGDAA
jgi:hypothetical protein